MPEGDLDRYRQTLLNLQGLLDSGSRSDRFKPSDTFALARVAFGDASASAATGEVVDISAEGMKLAFAGGTRVQVEQLCHIELGDEGADRFTLLGQVRWVDSHPLITVVGVQLLGQE